MEASDWSKFITADLAYLTNSKTILPLVIFWSGHFFNFFSQKNLLLGHITPIFFMWAPRLCPQWTILKTKFSKDLKFRSYMVKFFIFVRPISHWLMLVGQYAVRLCDGYDQSFPKWYDTWCSAQNWGLQAIFKILVIFFPILKKIIDNPLGPPFNISGPSKMYFGSCLMVNGSWGISMNKSGVRCRAALLIIMFMICNLLFHLPLPTVDPHYHLQ